MPPNLLAHGGEPATQRGMRVLRKAFFTGLLLCLPLVVTVYVVRLLIELAAKPSQWLVLEICNSTFGLEDNLAGNFWVEQAIVLISALIVVMGVTLVGFLSRYFMGRIVIESFENLIERVPMIKSVYISTKQIVTTFGAKNRANYKEVVLVQFPHPGAWTVAFVTNRDASEISEVLGYPVVHVFVPTTPNPTGGYFITLPVGEVKPLSMSVAEGMKLIVSGGAVLPERSRHPVEKDAGEA